ncbi:MAG: recombinase family protein, partial [Planctomycetes bacterium]|nr:recombinase family protein [Planctomycetota bacterium]
MQQISVPLQPKHPDGALQVLIIGRISTEYQNEESIEASYRFVEDYLQQIYSGPLSIKHLGERGSGMLTERASIREAEELIRDGQIDLVIAEDLSRIYRNPRHQYDFVQNAVDQDTRVICLGDNLDTADEHWEVMMGAAALRHGLFIPDTRRRVRRTATHSFHQGGMVTKVKFGYRKLTAEEADSGRFGPPGLMIAKDSEATATIRAIMERFLQGASYAALAQWLEDEQVPTGPYVESRQWSGWLVKSLLGDPILSGRRTFRKTICKPVYKTGKHRQQNNPNPEVKDYPELAHISVDEHEQVLQEMTRRSENVRKVRSPHGGPSKKRRNVPRSRSIWPGQAAKCAVCGGCLYYMGQHLKCENALHSGPRTCWNHVQVPAQLTRRRVIDWLKRYLGQVAGFRPWLREAAWEELLRIDRRRLQARNTSGTDVATLERQAANLAKAIAAGGQLDALLKESQAIEAALRKARQQQEPETAPTAVCGRFSSPTQLDPWLDDCLDSVADTSYEFADL